MLMDQVPDDVDFNATYMSGSNEDQKFLSNLAQLLATFLKEHYKLVEVIDEKPNVIRPDQNDRNELKEFHQRGLDYLLKLSEIEDVEVFKVWYIGNNYRKLEVSELKKLLKKCLL